jgi:enoyl-CoA hydratase
MSSAEPQASAFTPAELLVAAADPGWADRDGARCLILHLDAGPALAPGELAHLSGWLTSLPIPVIGLGAPRQAPLAEAVDVRLAVDDDLEPVLAAIRHAPHASAVLVQVLRAMGSLAVPEALTLESLAYATLQAGPEFARWLAGYRAGRVDRADRGDRDHRKGVPAADPVLLTRQDDHLSITLNSPGNRNALSTGLRDGLTDAFRLVAMDQTIRRIDIRGNGPCFSAGGDLTEFGSVTDPATAHEIRLRRMPARFLAACAERYHVHVHGACVGAGIELPAFAGSITATADAYFQLPEVAMGLIPGAGGCVSIPRRIGRQRTALMALTGRRVDAQQALAWGLVDAVIA